MTNTNKGMSWRTCYMMWPKLIQSCSIIHTHNRKKHSPTHTREEEEEGFAQTTRSTMWEIIPFTML